MQEAKEDIRARLNIEDVIGEYMELRRAGRNFKGLSPFTSERTPSFFVSPDKNIWHDFSSGKGGDIYSFVMEMEGLDFKGALEHLARKAGVDISLYQSAQAKSIAARKQRLYEAHRLAAHYYQYCLLHNKQAIAYVTQTRGLRQQTVADFTIGYAPNARDGLVNYLVGKGFRRQELAQSGLVNRFGGDLFKDRMMIPLMDPSGRVIGFTGRRLGTDESAPKYLNTPQTLLYDKGWHIFGLAQAKQAIRTHGYTVVVEGNVDVLSSHQAGVRQVVATAGTAMTEHHIKALVRLSPQLRLAFDGDKAGLDATERVIPIAQAAGAELSIITLPAGAKDPDELTRRDPQAWQAAIDAHQPVLDWVLSHYHKQHDMATAAGKRAFTSAAAKVIHHVADPVEREHYLHKAATIAGTSVEAMQQKLTTSQQPPSFKTPRRAPQARPGGAPTPQPQPHIQADTLLALALIDADVAQLLTPPVIALLHGQARQAIASYLAAHGPLPAGAIPPELQNYSQYVKILVLRADVQYASWSSQDRLLQASNSLRRIKAEHQKQQRTQLTEHIRQAEAAGDEAQVRALIAELQALNKQPKGDTL